MAQRAVLPDVGGEMATEPKDHRIAGCDHDLLIRIDTQVELLNKTVLAFEKQSQEDRSRLWAEKASSLELEAVSNRQDVSRSILEEKIGLAAELAVVQDHERRIRGLERYTWVAIGGLAVLQVVLKFGWPH